MKQFIILAMIAALAGCGGSKPSKRSAPVRMASGPISKACMSSDRKARSRALCGCVQAAANDTLSQSDQRKAVPFFSNPQKAQDTRQSDNSSNEAFWKRYKKFGAHAKALCS